MSFEITYAVFTDRGGRDVNEDSVGTAENKGNHCFILCDGLGGHGMGDQASSLVVDVFRSQFMKTDETVNFLGQTFLAAQDVLMGEQIRKNAQKRMKTTAAVLAADDRNAYIGHVGDSRVYVFHRNKVKTRTLDHSIPQMLVLTHDIKESQIRNHPDRNIVLRVMGVPWEDPQYDLMAPIPLKKCQAFLLCSDGFWELIEESEMCSLLKSASTVGEWVTNMAEVVRKNGADRNMDNFSAIGVWCSRVK